MTQRTASDLRFCSCCLLALTLLAALPASAGSGTGQAAKPPGEPVDGKGYPSVHFHYSFIPFDRSCTDLTGFEIEREWIDELSERLPAFRDYWDREGPRLLATLVAETGTPFRQREMIATMTLCNFRSMSHPLLLSMRRFLESASGGEARPMFLFGALVFHELLHTYVVDNLEASPLLEKYAGEPGSVKSHLHLMALMKRTYLKLGRGEELARIVAKDSKIGPIYARAWEIVNDLEGHEPFVEELGRRVYRPSKAVVH